MSRTNALFKEKYNSLLDHCATLHPGAAIAGSQQVSEALSISRSTARTIISAMLARGLLRREGRRMAITRRPLPADYFPTSETASQSDLMRDRFILRLVGGTAQPGDELNELRLAREFGVSTSTVREHLIRFARFGLIEKRPNRHWVLRGFTPAFMVELFEVRELFEQVSAAAFIRKPEDDPAWRSLDEIRDEHLALLPIMASDHTRYPPLDERFHKLIHHASNNRFIIDFFETVSVMFLYNYTRFQENVVERNSVSVREHLEYIDALRRRDPADVHYWCRKHLEKGREAFIRAVS